MCSTCGMCEMQLHLTLRLLISYIYGAPSKARNANVYIYGPTFGNAETVSFHFLHNVSTLNQCREVAGKVFTHKCDTGTLSALIQC